MTTRTPRDDHPHATFGSALQGLPEAAAGQEIGVGEENVLLRGVDRLQVRLLDVTPVQDVVAHQEGRGLAAARVRAGRRAVRQTIAAIEFRPQHDFPQPVQRLLNRRQQRALDAHRVVIARRDLVWRSAAGSGVAC